MRLAIIDLGTNSVRFDVHEIGPDNEVYRLYGEKMMIRLGEGVFTKGRLKTSSVELCVQAFKSFQRTMKDFKVQRILAFGTAALREAKDSERLLRRLKREAGISVRIISGDEEARLIARGVLMNEKSLRGSYALIDIGGGSTEVVVGQGKKILNLASFELGTARLQQVFLKEIPPVKPLKGLHSVELLRRHIRGTLLYRLVSEGWPKRKRLVCSSGTVKAIQKIMKAKFEASLIEKKLLHELVLQMSTMNKLELLRISGMEARRVDMILAGAILLEECMNAFQAETAEATEFSLRDGILDEQVEILKKQGRLLQHDPIQDLVETAKDLGAGEAELNQARQLAENFFDKLKPLHRLPDQWKKYLIAGALLHNVGKSISAVDANAHSYYVARFADVPQFEDWESELIAELCFYVRGGKLQKKEAPFKGDKSLQRVFLKLLGMLRLIGALAYQRESSIHLERLKIERSRVVLGISKRSRASMAILRAEQRKSLFEDVFKKSFQIEMV